MTKITFLTPEQEALIPEYQKKWKKIALSTERIDRESATQAVKEAYKIMRQSEPEIIFCASPFEALERLQTYVEQVKIVEIFDENQDNQTNPEETMSDRFSPLQFTLKFFTVIKNIFQLNKRQSKIKNTAIYKLINKINSQGLKSFNKQIKVSIPENITSADISK